MVESAPVPEGTIRLPAEIIHEFIDKVFFSVGLLPEHAKLCADVLTSADLRGIRSHGVARLPKFLNLIRRGLINKTPDMSFHAGSRTTGIYDADNGPGIVASTLPFRSTTRMLPSPVKTNIRLPSVASASVMIFAS